MAPDVAGRLAHHRLVGELPFAQALSAMAESKVVLNCCRVFTGGAHERVFYALSCGAVALTDSSTFLKEDFERRLGMVEQTGDLKRVDELVCDLLGSWDQLDRLQTQGREGYAQRHSWHERMHRILPSVKKHLQFPSGETERMP